MAIVPQPIVWNAGINGGGSFVSPITVMSVELNALASAGVAAGTQIYSSRAFGGSLFAEIFLILGTVTAMSAGAVVSGWFLQSPDGSNFELSNAAPARAPDFLIPMPATTGASTYKSQGIIRLPSLRYKILIQNNIFQTFTATGNQLIMAPVVYQAGL